MVLDINYFSNQIHVDDLQKLNDKELKFIIHLLQDELEEFNILHDFKAKGIIEACNKAFELLKDFRFILYGYMDVIKENDLHFCERANTKRLIDNIESIISDLKQLSTVRVSKEKVIYLGNNCSRNLQIIYNSINEYINEEYNIWEAERCRQKEESENS